MKLLIQALSPDVRAMYEGHGQYHAGDSGLDLFCVCDEVVPAGQRRFLKLGIRASAWSESGGSASWLLMPRSSISKTPLRLCNSVGLIDAGYRGELMVAVDNVKTTDHQVKKGDRIVQAVAFSGGPVRFELADELDETSRGDGGFGSTAVAAATTAAAGGGAPAPAAPAGAGMRLLVQPTCDEAARLYAGHGQYHKGDSGLDLFCVRDETVPAGERRFVRLGIKTSAWSGSQGVSWLLMPRSSISKTPLRLSNKVGLVDAGYRGEVIAAVDNIGSEDHQIKTGDRLVQAVAFDGGPVNFEMAEALDETSRGEGGFGSTVGTTTEPTAAATGKRALEAEAPGGPRVLLQPLSEEVAELYGGHGHFHKGDSGLDLFCVQDETVPAGETRLVRLGIRAAAWEGPANVSWLLMPRSSISKTPLRLCNSVGLIDAGYRGEVMAAVDNISSADHSIKRGDRIVQAVGFSGQPLSLKLVESLDDTTRGSGGFGSTTVPTPQGLQEIAAKRPCSSEGQSR